MFIPLLDIIWCKQICWNCFHEKWSCLVLQGIRSSLRGTKAARSSTEKTCGNHWLVLLRLQREQLKRCCAMRLSFNNWGCLCLPESEVKWSELWVMKTSVAHLQCPSYLTNLEFSFASQKHQTFCLPSSRTQFLAHLRAPDEFPKGVLSSL